MEGAPLSVSVLGTRSAPHSPGLSTCSGPGLSSVWVQVPAPGWDPSDQDLPLHLGVSRSLGGFSLFPGWLRLLCQQSGKRERKTGALGGVWVLTPS